MKIINIFIIFIIILLLISSFYIESITLGELWKNIHVNSLMGFQKIIENIALSINIDVWYKIFIPILNLKFLFLLILLQLILVIYILKNKISP